MKKNYFSLAIIFTLFYQFVQAQPITQIFNGSGNYTVPAGFSAVVTIEAWGAGGGGGNAGNGGKGGGGGGAYATVSTTLTAGTYTVTTGIGGAGGVGGGNSSFTTICVAGGGGGAITGGIGGAGGVVTTGTGNIGGTGATTGTNDGGGGGGSATNIANGGNGAVTAGGTGQGNGGAGGLANNGTGGNGIAPGGGGGGKAGPGVGSGNTGVGAAGRVIVTVNSVLAIKFNYFNASKGNVSNTLNWQASCSSTQAIFEIQRSNDGRNFTAIYTITATQERCAQPFTFTDNTNLTGAVYYRIRSIDIDGGAKYSAVIKLTGAQKNMQLTAIVPNPVSDRAQLNIATPKKDRIELSVISIDGKTVLQRIVDLQPGSSVISLEVGNLQKGVYTVKGVFSEGQSSSIKFVKQ
jgi:Secretion system C-terminal sorting domain